MKTKKLITAALSLAMISSATVLAVSSVSADTAADNAVDIKIEDTVAAAGQTVAIPVNVNIPAPGIAGCEFSISYDPEVLTVKSIEDGNISGGSGAADAELKANSSLADTMISGSEYSCLDYSIHSDKGEVAVMWCTGLEDQAYWLSGEGCFITIMAEVNADAAGKTSLGITAINRDGNDSIKFGYVDYSDNSEVTYSVNAAEGTLTIEGETTDTSESTENPDSSSSETTKPLPEGTLLGDVNCDGVVDIVDVTAIKQNILKLIELNEQETVNADVVSDGVIDVKDLGQLLKYIIKVIDKF